MSYLYRLQQTLKEKKLVLKLNLKVFALDFKIYAQFNISGIYIFPSENSFSF